jgi:DNA ligase (NAD+)
MVQNSKISNIAYMNNNEYLQMVEEVNRLRNEVHLFMNEEISENALDDLKHKITQYELANPDKVSKNSPNYTIAGGVRSGFTKVAHRKRMISLSDIFNLEELENWEKRYIKYAESVNIQLKDNPKYYVEPKIDGLALSLIYKNGELFQAATRGDGTEGEDVMNNVTQIASIPKSIPDKRNIEIRGEIFLTKSDFDDLNQAIIKGDKKGKMNGTGPDATFANPRNAASGTLRQLDSNVVKERNLSFIAYYLEFFE